MTEQELRALLDELRSLPHETEWVEFKESYYNPEDIGQYISALSNSASLHGHEHGYLVFGIRDTTHDVVGTSFKPKIKKKDKEELENWLLRGLEPRIDFKIHDFMYDGKPVVIFEIDTTKGRPVKFHWVKDNQRMNEGFIRVGSYKKPLANYPEKERKLWKKKPDIDWSAQVCEGASIADLEPEAITKAREEYNQTHPRLVGEIDGWDNITLLNKAGITKDGKITRAAIILLGKEESSHYLNPSVAQLSWILKDAGNNALDYEHFGPPLLLNIEKVLAKIRNITIRHLPDGTLFPKEIPQYDFWVIREALHNAIVHQDYELRDRVYIIETPDSLTFTNKGGFMLGSIEEVIKQDAPAKVSRNPLLSHAMVNLNMIDTIGSGIKKMFTKQKNRYFPMPDFDLHETDRVVVRVIGKILDENYTNLLINNTNLPLETVILLDKVQKSIIISKEESLFLKKHNLVKGRHPNIYIASSSAAMTGSPQQKASVQQAITLEQEAMRQQSLQAQQVKHDPIPIQLPKLHGVFVDREVERDILFRCLRGADNRLVVIIAPGGYGKTELIAKVLDDIAPGTSIATDDVHGILYLKCAIGDINLGNIFDGAGKIAGKRDEFLDVYTSKETTIAGKLEFFFSELSKVGNVWLVMDNFEDLLDTNDDSIKDDELREFLETAVAIKHNVRLIVTSRAVPKFKGSRKIEMVDLSSGLPEDQAIHYLRKEGTEYGLGDEDEEVLRTFVRRVHRIPMALSSVLGYLEEHYPVVKLGDLLKDDNLFLDFDRHDLKEGLKSLILQQIKRISPDAQLALSALSIFLKPTPPASLRYMLQGIGSVEFAAILTRLEKNRLITHNHGYYDMHPVVRSFIYEMIPESKPSVNGKGKGKGKDGKSALLTRSGLHKKAAEFFEKLRKPEKDWKTIDDLEPQLQEIHHLMRAGQYEEAARVLNIIDFNYLKLWGYPGIVIELREQLIGKLKDIYLASENAGHLGLAYMDTGRVRESLSYLEQALQIAKDNDDRIRISAWFNNLGNAVSELGEIHKAIEYYERALAIDREIGDRRSEGVELNNLGLAYSALDETRKAIEYHEQALAIDREIGYRRGEGIHIGDIGLAYSYLGETRKAIEYHEQALAIAREIGDRHVEGVALGCLGRVYSDLGETRKAIEYHEQALAIAKAIGDRRSEGYRLSNLGNTCFIEGDFNKAVEHFLQALDIAKSIENPFLTSEILIELAYTFHYHSNLHDAEQHYRESLKFDVPLVLCQSTVLLGILLLEKGKPAKAKVSAEAEDFIKRAISLCRQILEKTPDLFRQRYKLALALLASGDSHASLETYRRAITTCSAKGVVKRALMDLSLLERASQNTEGLSEARKLLTDTVGS
ncbi:MAG: tetratricopeptide repeat protein [Nitrospirae bacterium]|nr:tetratricopeptide repeat protein [Nitrospirota bacterium]